MKAALLVLALWLAGPAAAQQRVEERQLPNGLTIALSEMHRLPLVSVRVVLPLGGSALDPDGKSGLATLVADLLGGASGSMTGSEFNDALDDIGATMGLSVTKEAVVLTVFTAKENLDRALELTAQALRRPVVTQARLDVSRDMELRRLGNDRGEPGAQAEKRLALRLFPDHAYSRLPDEAGLKAVTLQDVRLLLARAAKPGSATVVAAGDMTLPEFESLMKKHFGDWREQRVEGVATVAGVASPASAPPVFPAGRGVEIDVIDMPGTAQAAIRAGEAAPYADDPDYLALSVANWVLGGTPIVSRLSKNLRESRRWTYDARSSLSSLPEASEFMIQTDVQTDAAAAAVREILKELARLRDEPVPAEELAATKRQLAGSFIRSLQEVQSVSDQLAAVELHGLPLDRLETYRARLDAVTAEQVQAAARKYLHPESLRLVISGDAAKLAKDLAAIGTVRVFDASGRPKPLG